MICIDVEASGTDCNKHSIVSLGAVDLDNPERRFYGECRVWEGAHIMKEALLVNGYTEEEVTDPTKQTEAELIKSFLLWTKDMSDRTLVGQNISFDRDMVRVACDRADIDYDLAYRTLDTHTLCYMHIIKRGLPAPIDVQHRHSNLNLDAVLNYCGIPDEPDPHNALTGALCHTEVTSRLLFDKPLLPEFSQFSIPWHKSDVTMI